MSTPPSDEKEPDNVVALSRYRAQLSRGRRLRRADELFAAPDPTRAIRALPGDEFFYVLHELGFPEAMEVLVHGTPEQVKTALDLALWDRDQLAPERTELWLGALVEAPYETVGAWLRALDIELVALLLRKRARVYDLSLEEPPDEPQGMLWNTPDRLFTVELLGDDEQNRVSLKLLDSLYRYSADMMRRILIGARAELDAELEELAYRWRSGRMADLGFIDFYEALEVYRELDPASVRVGDGAMPHARGASDQHEEPYLRLPLTLTERLQGNAPFAKAVAGISDARELSDLHFSLVALSNRVLSADRVTPGNDQAVAPVLARVMATLDLAVEFLARGSEERAVQAVRTVPLVQLFRVGVSLVGKLRKLGIALNKQTPFAPLRPAVDIFEEADRDLLDAVTGLRPMFPRTLDEPPAQGERPFASLSDLATATAALERVAAAVSLLIGLGIKPTDLTPEVLEQLGVDPTGVDAALLARTAIVGRLLEGPQAPFGALAPPARQKFEQMFDLGTESPTVTKELRAAATSILRAAAPGGTLTPALQAVADRWIAGLAPLEPVLTRPAPIAPRRNR